MLIVSLRKGFKIITRIKYLNDCDWDSSEVEVWSSVSQEHVLIIHGRFIKTNEIFYLFNVYAPCVIIFK